jgi:Transposase DDE domain
MDDKIIATFCLCDDLLKALHHQEDRQCQMNDAEVMTTAFIAALFFRGNHESARAMLKQYGYIPYMVSKSRFSRRLHRIKDICMIFFNMLANIWKTLNKEAIYVIDSLPIAVCDNIRIRRSKIYTKEDFRGYQASKKRYFYGLKIHLMVTQEGQPIECFLTPGSFGDVDALKYYAYELPYGTIIYADKAYNDYAIEDLLQEVEHITLIPIRKKNSHRALSPSVTFVQSYHRKRVETAGSLIEQLLPKSIHSLPDTFSKV